MKLGLCYAAVPVAFLLSSFNAIAHADPTDGPQAPIATYHDGKATAPVQQPASVTHVQRCTVAKDGAMTCEAPVALQGRADSASKR